MINYKGKGNETACTSEDRYSSVLMFGFTVRWCGLFWI